MTEVPVMVLRWLHSERERESWTADFIDIAPPPTSFPVARAKGFMLQLLATGQ